MITSHLKLKNWRNFREVDVQLRERMFVVGPNASGKSNLLDVFRFLRDIARSGGGLQKAILDRGGLGRIRCLAARRDPIVEVEVELSDASGEDANWVYSIGINQRPRGDRKPFLTHERVWHKRRQVLSRPDSEDERDPLRLTETHLEQISANSKFRDVSRFFETVLYMHLVPQLVRHPKAFSGPGIEGDPFGRNFLERIAQTPERTRKARLRIIEESLQAAVPYLKQLNYLIDAHEGGIPHLEATYDHWRAHGARQREFDFSDGTLRLIALLWGLLEGDSLLLLEKPELSLNAGIVQRLARLIYRAQRKRKRQVIISTHSSELLSDQGIGGEETILLTPSQEGTRVATAAAMEDVRQVLESGLSIADVVLPRTAPSTLSKLERFER